MGLKEDMINMGFGENRTVRSLQAVQVCFRIIFQITLSCAGLFSGLFQAKASTLGSLIVLLISQKFIGLFTNLYQKKVASGLTFMFLSTGQWSVLLHGWRLMRMIPT